MSSSSKDLVAEIEAHVREVKDFPKQGIIFRDITPLLKSPRVWRSTVAELSLMASSMKPTIIACIEARGFVIGVALAQEMSLPLILIRKAGKLPPPVEGGDYGLEYGSDRLEISTGCVTPDDKVLVVDDVLATGGTAELAASLVTKQSADVVGFLFLLEIVPLHGRSRLTGPVSTLLKY